MGNDGEEVWVMMGRACSIDVDCIGTSAGIGVLLFRK